MELQKLFDAYMAAKDLWTACRMARVYRDYEVRESEYLVAKAAYESACSVAPVPNVR